jgi:ketosteroid isomerase-like protein
MYRAIVARRVRTAWEQLARGDYEYVLGQLAPAFRHSFAGDHALGGERSSRDAQRAWFERVFRLLPGIEFTVQDVLVRGWPWRDSRGLGRRRSSRPPGRRWHRTPRPR